MIDQENQTSTKLRNLMLGALYKMGDPKRQDSILKAWELSKLSIKNIFNFL